MDILILSVSVISLVVSVIILAVVSAKLKNSGSDAIDRKLGVQSDKFSKELSITRQEVNNQISNSISSFSNTFSEQQKMIFTQQNEKIETLSKTVETSIQSLEKRMNELKESSEKSSETLKNTVHDSLNEVRQGNEKSLGEIKKSVDEKLQTSIEERITRSFKEVSDRLKDVYSGLGEMKTLANGVGDLKKVLSNVKTRGILGEIQLGAILSEILSPEQYETNIATVPESENRVEFAVKLPGNDEVPVYLPIDSKFPADAYIALQDAYETCDPEKIKSARNSLETRIKQFAKDITTKYVSVPYTTDFAIMFLPTEGLYAEIVQMGLVEQLQRNFKVNIAGPTTMAALLNSLQTGFKTLAIQKRSSEVWEILGAVKTEFEKFEEALIDAQRKMNQASDGIEKLVGTRTRAIVRKLRGVSVLPSDKAVDVLEDKDE